MEYVYSLNEDDYNDLEDIENEIDEINSEYDNVKIDFVYRGEKVIQTNSMFVNGSDIIENITDRAYDSGGEWSGRYCEDLESKVHRDNIEKLVIDYLDKNGINPSFYLVENVKKIPIEEIHNQG